MENDPLDDPELVEARQEAEAREKQGTAGGGEGRGPPKGWSMMRIGPSFNRDSWLVGLIMALGTYWCMLACCSGPAPWRLRFRSWCGGPSRESSAAEPDAEDEAAANEAQIASNPLRAERRSVRSMGLRRTQEFRGRPQQARYSADASGRRRVTRPAACPSCKRRNCCWPDMEISRGSSTGSMRNARSLTRSRTTRTRSVKSTRSFSPCRWPSIRGSSARGRSTPRR